jgi:hypothetical protein
MKFATLLAIAVLASAQGRAYSPQTRAAEGVPDAVDAKLHSDVIKLVELSGIRAAMQNNLKQIVDRGKARMLQLCTGCDPAYSDEWAKRMLTRLNIDDFIDVYVRVYEKYFSDDEIEELIAAQNQIRKSQRPNLSDELKQKLAAQMVTIQSEIIGGTTQLGAKLGGEIGKEIEIEHPEYFKNVSKVARMFDYASGVSQAAIAVMPAQQAGQGSGSIAPTPKVSFEDPSGIQETMGYDEILRRFGPPSAKVTAGPGQETLYYSRKDLAVAVTLQNGKVASVRKSGPAAQADAKTP